MDTKWKNILDEYSKMNILGGTMAGVGAFMLIFISAYGYLYVSSSTLLVSLFFGNISSAGGIVILMKEYFDQRDGIWRKEDWGYEAWKKWWRKNARFIRGIGIGLLLFFAMINISTFSRWGLFSGFLQYVICEINLWYNKQRSLDEFVKYKEGETRRKIEEALEIERNSSEKVSKSDQLRIDLITNVSHDLKTPLTSMVGYIELMKKEELSDVMQDYVNVLSQRAEKLKEMINSLFSLAKASSGNVELKMERFEVNRLIEQIFADMDEQISRSGLEIVTRFTADSTEIVSDNMYFYRIIQNLMENALKYSATGTRVFVKTFVTDPGTGGASEQKSARTETGELAIGVIEAGHAAAEEQITENIASDRRIGIEITNTAGYRMDFDAGDILERFARADKARTTEGNGLGLAIVSTYAKALGGNFEIRTDCDQFKACLEFGVLQHSF